MAANDVSLNNPAGRLHRILSRAKSAGQPNVLLAFATAFEIPPTNISEILLNLGKLGLAVDEVSEELRRANDTDNLEEYLESAPHLKSALSIQHLGVTWETFKNHIRDEDLRALRYCSKALSKISLEEVLSDEQIKDLKTKVEALYEDVLGSNDVEPQLRRVILGHLDSIRRAIHEYRITGLRPLAEALSITACTLAEPRKKKRGKPKKEQPEPKAKSTLNKLREFVKYAVELTKLWRLIHPMLRFAKDQLPLLKEGYEKVKDLLPPPTQ
jgi:hypothetical protein